MARLNGSKEVLVLRAVQAFQGLSALCSPPNVKLPIRDFSQNSTTALIFMKTNYFR